MKWKKSRGYSLLEMLVAMAVFALAGTLTVSMFTLGSKYSAMGGALVDVQSSSQSALNRMVSELRESDMAGVGINSSHNAVMMISARNTQGSFQVYSSGAQSTYYGSPYWQKWICYYLTSQPGTSANYLIRKAGDPFGSGFPRPDMPSIPAGWQTTFQSSAIQGEIVARDVSTMNVQDVNCAVTGNPLYLQIVSAQRFRGQVTSYNAGNSFTFGCPSTGYWLEIPVKN